jgi:hypothetical protein
MVRKMMGPPIAHSKIKIEKLNFYSLGKAHPVRGIWAKLFFGQEFLPEGTKIIGYREISKISLIF